MLLTVVLQSESLQNTDWLLRWMADKDSLAVVLLQYFPPLLWLYQTVQGHWHYGMYFIVLSIGVVGTCYWMVSTQYLSLALRQTEVQTQVHRSAKWYKRQALSTPFMALYRMEMRDVLKSPAYMLNCVGGAFVVPLMFVPLCYHVKNNEEFSKLIHWLSTFSSPEGIVLVITFLFCFCSMMGLASSTAVSREGGVHVMRKTLPVDSRTVLLAKVAMGMTFNALTCMVLTAVGCLLLPTYSLWLCVALFISQLYSFSYCVFSILLDARHPRFDWKNETEAVKQSTNALLSLLLGFGLIALLGGGVWAILLVGTMNNILVYVVLMLSLYAVIAWLMLQKWSCKFYEMHE